MIAHAVLPHWQALKSEVSERLVPRAYCLSPPLSGPPSLLPLLCGHAHCLEVVSSPDQVPAALGHLDVSSVMLDRCPAQFGPQGLPPPLLLEPLGLG